MYVESGMHGLGKSFFKKIAETIKTTIQKPIIATEQLLKGDIKGSIMTTLTPSFVTPKPIATSGDTGASPQPTAAITPDVQPVAAPPVAAPPVMSPVPPVYYQPMPFPPMNYAQQPAGLVPDATQTVDPSPSQVTAQVAAPVSSTPKWLLPALAAGAVAFLALK